MNKKPFNWEDFLRKNSVTLLFVVLCVGAYFASGMELTFLLPELFTRISRNAFLVLSLLIPVVAGLGLNFGIVIGAIAAQVSIFFVIHMGFTGMPGILMCVVICTPLAMLFGWLVGKLFNSMKGTEMVGGLVSGYFADGIYQLFFLFILGGVIPIVDKKLMISTGIGVKNAINLDGNLKYAVDNVPMIRILDLLFWVVLAVTAIMLIVRAVRKQDLKLKSTLLRIAPVLLLYAISFIPSVSAFMSTDRLLLLNAVELGALAAVLYCVYTFIKHRFVDKQAGFPKKLLWILGAAVAAYALTYIPALTAALLAVRLPVLTYLLLIGLCAFISWFMNTKLGQEMRTVGQSRPVATSAGIDVDRIRIIAMIMSTVLASYGQLISLQNIGTVATYGAHTNVGLYAIAALLVGGASVQKATTSQAMLGIVLFHTLFILSPIAGKELLGNAQIGEYFRVFVAYGVIAVSLAMHAWSRLASQKKAESWLDASKEEKEKV